MEFDSKTIQLPDPEYENCSPLPSAPCKPIKRHSVPAVESTETEIDNPLEPESIKNKRRAFKEAFKKGEIPEELKEEWRLVAYESPEGQNFHEYCLSTAKELYNPATPQGKAIETLLAHHNFERNPVRFFLSKIADPNAWYIPCSNPPIIVLTEGLFTNRKFRKEDDTPVTESIIHTPDELKLIVGHEMTHLKLEDIFGHHENSKPEEGLADGYPLKLLADSGLNPESALWMRKKIQQINKTSRNGKFEIWSKIIDDHPLEETRYSILENSLTAIRKQRGELNELKTSAPFENTDPYIQNIRSAKHASYLEKKLPENYAELPPPTQLEILYKILVDNDSKYQIRYDDISGKITQLEGKIDPQAAKKTIDAMADLIMEKIPQEEFSIYQKVYRAISRLENPKTQRLKPLGRLRPLAETAERFIETVKKNQGYGAIRNEAQKLLTALDAESLFESGNGQKFILALDWPKFTLPATVSEYSRTPVEWNPLRKLVNDENCLRAALAMGLGYDKEVYVAAAANFELALPTFAAYKKKSLKEELEESITPKREPLRVLLKEVKDEKETTTLENCDIDEEGRIKSLNPNDWGLGNPEVEKRRKIRKQSIEKLIIRYIAERDSGDERKKTEAIRQIEIAKNIYFSSYGYNELPICQELAETDLETFLDLNLQLLDEPLASNIIYTQLNAVADKGDNKKIIRKFFGFQEDGSRKKGKLEINPIGVSIDSDRKKTTVSQQASLYFVLKNKKGIFTSREILQLCGEAIFKVLDEFSKDKDWSQDFIKLITPHCIEENIPLPQPDPGWEEICSYLEQNKNNTFPKIICAVAVCHAAIALSEEKKPTALQMAEFLQHVEKYPETIKGKIKKHANNLIANEEITDLKESIKIWKVLEREDILDIVESKEYLEKIIQKLAAHEAPEKIEFAKSLLEGERINHALLREKLIKIFIDCELELYGKDDGTEVYEKRIQPEIEWIQKKVNRIDQPILLNRLGKELETQRNATSALEDALPNIQKKDIENASILGILGETSLTLLKNSPKLQKIFLEFLTSPLTSKSLKKVIEKAEDESVGYEEFWGKRGEGKKLKPKEKKEGAKSIYENFWHAPFEIRVWIVKELFDDEKTLQTTLLQTVDLLFQKEDPYKSETVDFMQSYVSSLPDYAQLVALAAMLSANEETDGTLGETIGLFAEKMGPAETKVAQIAEGHPNVPKDISMGLRRLKFAADEPPRWEVFHWIKNIENKLLSSYKENPECRDKSENLKIDRIGRVLGSGSIFIAVEIFLSDGTRQVIALKRPYALERGKSGFGTLEKCLDNLGKNHPITGTMNELLAGARKRLEYETSCPLAPLQYSTAQKIYSGQQIKIQDDIFHFDAIPVTASGEQFFMMHYAAGQHFSTLPESDPEQIQYRKNCAKAVITQELTNILTGVFDSDRHGGNVLIEGNNIHHIDFKGMSLARVTPHGYEQLARLALDIIPAVAIGKDILTAFLESQKKIKEEEKNLDPYVIEAVKAVVSLGEYIRELSPAEINEILQNILKRTSESPFMEALKNPKNFTAAT